MHKTCLLGTVVMAETDGNACVGTERRNDEVPIEVPIVIGNTWK